MRLVTTISNISELEMAKKSDIIELRLDLGNFENVPPGKYIVTYRRKADGGLYVGNEEERIAKLRDNAKRVKAEFVDIEFDVEDSILDLFDCDVIESYHNFKETPNYEFLKNLVENKRGDHFKVATMGRSIEDWKRIAKLLIEFDGTIAFLIGEKFKFTRIAAAMLGSPFIYCYVGSKKAPGQFELEEALKILKKLGVRE
ncbi:MAG: type I 3-dehydroquinate dehydratase [Archaeoglobaceae archaeon]|nr:type I 3-dehydroquinate dehydratase [Archaeoglobaceae archaeon]MDW7989258.1 type I 3-dehydroquinate dehydratase [Archaeoglobaceae archaeon]